MNRPTLLQLTLAAALYVTAGTACTDHLAPTEGTDIPGSEGGPLTGQPVCIGATSLSFTGHVQTRANAPAETTFPADGTTMTVYLLDAEADDALLQQADYTYTDGAWTADDGQGLYWPDNSGTYRFTAISPARAANDCTDGKNLTVSLPIEWTTDELEEWEALRVTATPTEAQPTTAPIALNLCHPLTQIEAVMTTTTTAALIDAPTSGFLSLTGSGTTQLTTTPLATLFQPDKNMPVYLGYILPGAAMPQLATDDQIYNLTLPDGQPSLQGGEVVSVTDLEGFTIIYTTPGELMNTMNNTPGAWEETKLAIFGQLNQQDITDFLTKAFNETNLLTHLYFYASAPGVEIPEYTCNGNFGTKPVLQEIILPQGITAIGMQSFCYINNLEKVILPAGIGTIGARCFSQSNNLAYICWRGTTFPSCRFYAFSTISGSSNLLLPDMTDPAAINLHAIGSEDSRWPTVYYNYRGGDLLDTDNYTYLDQSTL